MGLALGAWSGSRDSGGRDRGGVYLPAPQSDLVNVLPHAPNAPVIQLAMLDTVGGTRGTDMNELATLKGTWKESAVQQFSSASELEAWEKNWPNGDRRPEAKIIYDAAAGEVRVSGRSQGRVFEKTFPVEKDLATTLQQVGVFIREQAKR